MGLSNMKKEKKWGLFSRFGIEIEYMICDQETLRVKPISDCIIKDLSGVIQNEVSLGKVAVSNELALHVIELKTDAALTCLEEAPALFQNVVDRLNGIAKKHHAVLVPSGMHPFMNPASETKLWQHEQNPIYEAYNAIFNCSGHGWSNLQSSHLNLPFGSEEEFILLHRAIRLLLPLFSALSASTPVVEGKKTGTLDTRLFVYRNNQARIPTIGGKIVPEDVHSFNEYKTMILEPMWRDIAPYDPEEILREEWLNSRGAIARFERDAIEIRVLDTQESPLQDIAIHYAIVSMLTEMIRRCKESKTLGKEIATEDLSHLFFEVARFGQKACIDNSAYLALFSKNTPCTVHELLRYLLQSTLAKNPDGILEKGIRTILEEGPLACRIEKALSNDLSEKNLVRVWKKLSNCLARGEPFYALTNV